MDLVENEMNLAETQAQMRQLVEAVDLLRSAAYTVVSILDTLLADSLETRPPTVSPKKTKKKQTGLRKMIREMMAAEPSKQWTVPGLTVAVQERGLLVDTDFPYNVVRNTLATMSDIDRKKGHDANNHPTVWHQLKTS